MRKRRLFLYSLTLILTLVPSFFLLEAGTPQIPVRIYRVSLTYQPGSTLANTSSLTGNITLVGSSLIPTTALSSLTTMPPVHSYLRIVSGSLTTYAAVFWQTGNDGLQHAIFDHLPILVTSPNSPASFYYAGFSTSELNLGIH